MSVFGRKYAQLSKPNFVSYVDGNYAVSGEGRHIATDQVYVGKFTDDSRKLTRRFAQDDSRNRG